MAQPNIYRATIEPGFNGGLMLDKFLIGGVRIVATKAQRNAIPFLSRRLDAEASTLCIVTSEQRIYQLLNNPTGNTSDSDWNVFELGAGSAFRPVGDWDSSNSDIVLSDTGAAGRNGEFYFVKNTPTPTTVQFDDLFNNEPTEVVNGDLVVSVGNRWILVKSSVTWDSISKPSVITDYVDGIVIAHSHAMSDITGLTDALATKFDVDSLADTTADFDDVPDDAPVGVGFLRQWYYTTSQVYTKAEVYNKTETYTKSEVDGLIAGIDTTTDHGSLTGLLDDDHPQYLTNGRGDARYIKLSGTSNLTGAITVSSSSGQNVTFSGASSSFVVNRTGTKTVNLTLDPGSGGFGSGGLSFTVQSSGAGLYLKSDNNLLEIGTTAADMSLRLGVPDYSLTSSGSQNHNFYFGSPALAETIASGNTNAFNIIISDDAVVTNNGNSGSVLGDCYLIGGDSNTLLINSGAVTRMGASGITGGIFNKITVSGITQLFAQHIVGGAFNNITISNYNETSSIIVAGYNNLVTAPDQAVAMGYYAQADGHASLAFGDVTTYFTPTDTIAGLSTATHHTGTVYRVLAKGKHAINMSANSTAQTSGNGALADYSVIFGGIDGHIPSDATGSVVISGNGINARAGETYQVYVPNFNIVTTPSNDNTLTQILARDATTGQIKYRSASSIATTFGTVGQIPFTNSGGTAFQYSSQLVYTISSNNFVHGADISVSGVGANSNNFIVGNNHTYTATANARWNHIHGEEHTLNASVGKIEDSCILGGDASTLSCTGSGTLGMILATIVGGGIHLINNPNANTLSNGAIIAGGVRNTIIESIGFGTPFGSVNGSGIFAGTLNFVTGHAGLVLGGIKGEAAGLYSMVHGFMADMTNGNDQTSAPRVLASGNNAINFSANSNSQTSGHGALANYCGILFGTDHHIPSDATSSAVIGGDGISVGAGVTNTVHFPKVRFGLGNSASITQADTNDNIVVRNATTGELELRDALSMNKVPTYTVSTLPSASTAAKIIYVSNETGGAVLAFSDGTNWRRVTDRNVVS